MANPPFPAPTFPPGTQDPPLTVACVLKTPANPQLHYDASWVQKLQRGVARHLSVPHRFVCLSDRPVPGVTVQPLRHDWMLYWSKIELFRPGLFTGPTLYFDIDSMITGSLDGLVGPFDGMVMLQDFYPSFLNSGLMWWDASDPVYAALYERMCDDAIGTMLKHRYRGATNYGDQQFIADTLRDYAVNLSSWQQLRPRDWFLEFSFQNRLNPVVQQPPESVKVCYCLGAPKFDDFAGLPLVANNWR